MVSVTYQKTMFYCLVVPQSDHYLIIKYRNLVRVDRLQKGRDDQNDSPSVKILSIWLLPVKNNTSLKEKENNKTRVLCMKRVIVFEKMGHEDLLGHK